MRSIRGIGLAVLVAVLVASLLAGVSAASAQTIRVGFHAPLTGLAASDGKSALNGAELALQQINGAGAVAGRKLELVVHDDQAKADQAVPLPNKYIGEGLKVVISGSYSAPTRAPAGVSDGAKIPYVSAYAIHPDITRAGIHLFRTSFMGEVQGRAPATLVDEGLKKKKVTLVTLNNDSGQALIRADITPPSTSITVPTPRGSTSGTIALSATASDDVGVVAVPFNVDGTPVRSEDLSAPYSISWNSRSVPNGRYSITAFSRDAVGKTGTSPTVSVTVSNPGPVSGFAIPLTVSETAGVDRTNDPVTSGLPLPPGTQTTDWSLWDSSTDTQVPLQITSLPGRTPWILLDFQSSPAANGTKTYVLKDIPASTSTLPSTPLTIEDTTTQITITTGPLKVSLSKTSLNLFETVFLDRNRDGLFDSAEQVIAPQSENLAITDSTTGQIYSGKGTPSRIEWEYRGPLRATLRIDGHYRTPSGTSYLAYTTRLTFFAGRSDVKIEHILRNSSPTNRRNVKVQSAVIRIGPGYETVRATRSGSTSWKHVGDGGITYELIPSSFYIGTTAIDTTTNRGLIIPDQTYHGAILVADFAEGLSATEQAARLAAARSPLFANASPEWYSSYGELTTTHFSTVEDERQANQTWGWSWTTGQEPSRPPSPDAVFGWQDVHGVTEGDSVWGSTLMYVRTGQRGYWDQARAWARHYKWEYAFRTDGFPYRPPSGRPAIPLSTTTKADQSYLTKVRAGKVDVVTWGADHLYGWGLVDYYYLTGDTDALEAAKDLGEVSESVYAPGVPGTTWMTLEGERGGARSLLLATRLAETQDMRWQHYMEHLAHLWLRSPDWDERGFYYRGRARTDATIAKGAYDAGARQMIPFEQAFLTHAFDRYHEVTDDPLIKVEMRDRLIAMARWIHQYALHPTYQHGSYHIAMDYPGPGQLWYTSFDKDPAHPTLTPLYTVASVDTLIRGWRLTSEPELLERARYHWERGSKAFTNDFIRRVSDTRVGRFLSGSDLGYAQLLFYEIAHAGDPTDDPPTVSLTAPLGGVTVSGTSVSVSADAHDDHDVIGVQFKLDGDDFGAEDTSAPYALTWNTATVINGPHILTAVARDAAGHTTTSLAVSVTVSNPIPTPLLSVSPPTLAFAAVYGGCNPASQTLSIQDPGGGTMSWTASDPVPWLTLSPTSGTDDGVVTAAVSTTGLLLGTYTGSITITAPGASESPQTIEVTVTIVGSSSGLVGYWSLDEGQGTTTQDHSGHQNFGILQNGPIWITGRVGTALDFDRDDDSLLVGSDQTLDIIIWDS